MTITRRSILMCFAAASLCALFTRPALAADPVTLKISHQFPGGTIDEGDFRDRLCRRFAAEVEKRTGGAVTGTVYAGSSLMKTNAQFSAMRKGALDMSLVPLSYAGGEVPETNIGLMPGVVTSYEQGMSWKNAEVGKALSDVLADKGVIIVSWIWQAGGVASRTKPIIEPEDAKGLKVRGGSREMDMVLKEAGAAVLTYAIQRNLCRDADRRIGCRDDLLHQPDFLPSGRSGQATDHRPRQGLLVHAGAVDDLEVRSSKSCPRRIRM